MLQNIREKFTGWIAISILALIGVTFIFVGGANFAFIGSNYAAKVDGIEIGLGQFEQSYRDELQRNPQYAQLPANLREQLRRNILEQLIQQRVVDNYLTDAGYQISDEQIAVLIQRTPDFQVDGRFDMETYRNLLAQNGYEPSDFERAQRVSLRRDQLQRAIRGSAVLTPAAYRRYLNLAAEQRIVAMATLDPASVEEQISITDEMIGSYYDNNPMLYQLEESADVQYVEIQRSDIAESVAVTEDELTQYYEESKDRYLQDEQRQARHILVLFNDDEAAAEAKAEELLGRINAGEAFDAIAAESSDDIATANQGGDLGVRTRSQLPGNLGRAIFAMDEGDVTGPVKTDFGFHIVRLDSILEQGALPFEQVRAELTAELQDEKAESMFRDLERRMSDALFDATTIEELATAIDMEIQTLEGFTRSGVAPFEGNLAVIDAIFDEIVLTGEQMSEIIEIDSRRSAVFAVTSHRPATRQSLEDVREQVAEALKADMAEALMAAKADEMIAALDGGAEFAAAAEAIGATPADPVIMTRDNQDADQFVAVAVFTAVKPTQDNPTTGSTRNGEGGYTVYSIEAVLPGRPEVVPVEQRDAGKLQLTDQAGIGEFIAFVQSLREGSEVIINEDALAAQDLL
jgi:peptidyl-prolyl cis-trans isomerase D